MDSSKIVGAVVIGRNEGARLERCLASLRRQFHAIVYVDSGSTDNSVVAAQSAGASVINLDMGKPFTAARARNAGFKHLLRNHNIQFVQFIDGDCEMREGWLDAALSFLSQNPVVAVACGRRRERHPDASVYNQLCDIEWNTPVGKTKACGGDALMRVEALAAVSGFDPSLIAGEEPELCVRLRAKGWEIWRIDQEMTWHDADISKFSQWWSRTKRAGFAYAEGAAMHGSPPERHRVQEVKRSIVWGFTIPIVTLVLGVFVNPWLFLCGLVYPAQIARLALRSGATKVAWQRALFLTLGKFPEALGALTFYKGRFLRKRSTLIEYK